MLLARSSGTAHGVDFERRAGGSGRLVKAAHVESSAERRVHRLHTPEQQPMATRLNILTCLQQAQGLAEASYRFPQPHPRAWLVLPASPLQAGARQKLRVWIHTQNSGDTPYPVSIVHLHGNRPGPQSISSAEREK